MAEITKSDQESGRDFVEFKAKTAMPLSSGEFGCALTEVVENGLVTVPSADGQKLSPVFKELATPKLPPLARENRARLQMQSPTKLFFYWSLKSNPFQILNTALGPQTGSYALVVKLVDLRSNSEELHPAEADGSWWFNVRPDGNYRAEIGFYAPNRPYVRILFSNTVATPRQAPSTRPADTAQWRVSADRFSRVLSVAGFERDAFDVAIAGDDQAAANVATQTAFSRFAGDENGTHRFEAAELRLVLLALASGESLETLRGRISPGLFAFLQSNAGRMTGERAAEVLKEDFGVETEEIAGEESGAAVFGASLVNFPRVLRKRRNFAVDLSPVSSFTV